MSPGAGKRIIDGAERLQRSKEDVRPGLSSLDYLVTDLRPVNIYLIEGCVSKAHHLSELY